MVEVLPDNAVALTLDLKMTDGHTVQDWEVMYAILTATELKFYPSRMRISEHDVLHRFSSDDLQFFDA